ncbi:MAG: PD40 domain-containing protein [Acidobacteria bacterium]|nr:PD40 domain-containing protein [Acidobacteriota bacterium]
MWADTVAPRLLWDDLQVSHLGAPSPDGRFLTLSDPKTGSLAIRMIATGEVKRLTAPVAGEFAYFSIVSADSRRIAYAWRNREGFYELRVIDAAGGEPVTVHRNRERPFVQPCAWSPDGSRILTLFFREDNVSQIAFVPAGGGNVQVLASLDWVYPNKMALSPDGKWIAFDDLRTEAEGRRTIFVLATDGSAKKRVLGKPEHDTFPLFTADGKRIVFLRGGDLYHAAVDGGEAARIGTLGRALPLGITRNNVLYYALRNGEPGIFVHAPGEKPVRLGNASSDPAWSPDGTRLAFLTRAANENFGMESKFIAVADSASGKTTVLDPKLAHVDSVSWQRDGRALLVGGSDRHGQRGLFVIDAESGVAKPLVREHAGTYMGLEGVDTAKGVVYTNGESIRLRDAAGTEHDLYRASGATVKHLTVSHDGLRIAYALRADGVENIFTMGLDSSMARQAANLRGGGAAGLDWEADNQTLLAAIPTSPPSVWRIFPTGEKPFRLGWEFRPTGAVRVQPKQGRLAYLSGYTKTEIHAINCPE